MPKTDLMITSISSFISFGNMVGVKVVVAILKKKEKILNDTNTLLIRYKYLHDHIHA